MNSQKTIVNQIKEAVLSADETVEVLLFGSRARGDFHDESDWDILILTDEKVNDELRLSFIEVLIPLEIKFITAINSIVKNRVEWKDQTYSDLYINIHEDGIVL